jgi:hypothetical protein
LVVIEVAPLKLGTAHSGVGVAIRGAVTPSSSGGPGDVSGGDDPRVIDKIIDRPGGPQSFIPIAHSNPGSSPSNGFRCDGLVWVSIGFPKVHTHHEGSVAGSDRKKRGEGKNRSGTGIDLHKLVNASKEKPPESDFVNSKTSDFVHEKNRFRSFLRLNSKLFFDLVISYPLWNETAR